MKCEWKDHQGNKDEGHGEGNWWLKDPEWVLLCPACKNNYWVNKIKEIEKEVIRNLKKNGNYKQ